MKDNKKMFITAVIIWGICILGILVYHIYTMKTNQEANTQNNESTKTETTEKTTLMQATSTDNIKKENGLVKLEYLQGLSWIEIRDYADELFGERRVNYNEGDEAFLRHIVCKLEETTKRLQDDDYDIRKNCISFGGSIPVKHTDYEIFSKEIQVILDAYNRDNEIQVICYPKKYDNGNTRFELYSYNYPVTNIGQIARIKLGASFYEKSKEFGSGLRESTIYFENYGFAQHPYIPEGNLVVVNGVSYLTKEGEINSSEYYTYDELSEQHISIPIDRNQKHMIHICTEARDLGWVLPATLDAIPNE